MQAVLSILILLLYVTGFPSEPTPPGQLLKAYQIKISFITNNKRKTVKLSVLSLVLQKSFSQQGKYKFVTIIKLLLLLQHTGHNLRPRAHNFALPIKDDRNFISRVLYGVLN